MTRADQAHALRTEFERVAAVALAEDLERGALTTDVTTVAIVPDTTFGAATITAKQDGVVAGLAAIAATFGQLDGRVEVTLRCRDGDRVAPGDVVATIEGPVRAILAGERTALNLVGHLSGIATLVRAFADRADATTLVDTRKTLPGLRALQKFAVRCGGGSNHRFALWDGVLVKDNHIVAAGSLGEAVRRVAAQTSLPVQAECTSLAEVDEALEAGAHAVLLDNRTPEELRELTRRIKERADHVMVEASGGVTLDNVSEIASTGVDRISVGAFTHSAPALDVSLSLDRVWEQED